jgi:hypothetical protein
MIGETFVLWKEEFSNKAYRDQMGIWQSGYVVRKEYVVTIIETKKVRGMWGSDEYDGWKAISEEGFVFTCNWDVFPDDSPTPSYYWDGVDDGIGGYWRPVDAIQASQMFPHVDALGNKVIPAGAKICEKHGVLFLDECCWHCEYENIKANKANS